MYVKLSTSVKDSSSKQALVLLFEKLLFSNNVAKLVQMNDYLHDIGKAHQAMPNCTDLLPQHWHLMKVTGMNRCYYSKQSVNY